MRTVSCIIFRRQGFVSFAVHGAAGRTNMFYFSATNALLNGGEIQIFNYGNCKRDFTYIDDIIECIYQVMGDAPEQGNGEDGLPIPTIILEGGRGRICWII